MASYPETTEPVIPSPNQEGTRYTYRFTNVQMYNVNYVNDIFQQNSTVSNQYVGQKIGVVEDTGGNRVVGVWGQHIETVTY